MSKKTSKDQALKDWEKTKQREKYWEKIFEKMKQKRHEKPGITEYQ